MPASMDPLPKPGYQTTEFWMSIIAVIGSLLSSYFGVSSTVRPPDESPAVASAPGARHAKGAVVGGGGLMAAAIIAWRYISSRTAVKTGGGEQLTTAATFNQLIQSALAKVITRQSPESSAKPLGEGKG